ncbi:transposase [Carnobacterium maltaromaticum]|nr:transposase [Carnobacterium maltaromaticum]
MEKYDAGFKLQVVQSYLSVEGWYGYLATKLKIKSHSTVVKWGHQ